VPDPATRTSADASTGSGFLDHAGKQPRKIEMLQVDSCVGVRRTRWGTCDTTRAAQLDALPIGNYHRPPLNTLAARSRAHLAAWRVAPDTTVPPETASASPGHPQCYRPRVGL